MNDTLGALKDMVPALVNEKKPSKALIYRRAVEHMTRVEQHNKVLLRQNEELQKKLHETDHILEETERKLKDTSLQGPGVMIASPIKQGDIDLLLRVAADNAEWQEVASGFGVFGFSSPNGDTPRVTVWKKRVRFPTPFFLLQI